MDQEEEDLVIVSCLYGIILEEQRKRERKRKKQWVVDNLKRIRERRLARRHQISLQKLRKNENLGRHPKMVCSHYLFILSH